MDLQDIEETYNLLHFEHRFWLQIIGDHCIFIRDALPVGYSQSKWSNSLSAADNLLSELKDTDELSVPARHITSRAKTLAMSCVTMKADLLSEMRTKNLNVGLLPTSIVHMIDEENEYIAILNNKESELAAIHTLWTLDCKDHIRDIMCTIDYSQRSYLKKLKNLKKQYSEAGSEYSTLSKLNSITNSTVSISPTKQEYCEVFLHVLEELSVLKVSGVVLAKFKPLLIDHIIREQAYYLIKTGSKTIFNPISDRAV